MKSSSTSSARQSNSWSFKPNVFLRYSTPSYIRQSASSRRTFFCYYNNKRYDRLSRRRTYPLYVRKKYPTFSFSASSESTSSSTTKNKQQQQQQPTSPPAVFSALFGRAATISSATASTTAHHSIPTTLSFVGLAQYPMPLHAYTPVFHTQSMLFLFGFLFFPCWWIGAFYQTEKQSIKQQQDQKHSTLTRMPVHSSLLANGRTSSRIFWIPQQEDEEKGMAFQNYQQFYHHISTSSFHHHNQNTIGPLRLQHWIEKEHHMYRRWNKYMSFASIGIIALCIAMLIWYDIGVRRAWWKKLY